MGSLSSPCRSRIVRKSGRSSSEVSSDEDLPQISANIGQAVRAAALRRNHVVGTDLGAFPVNSWRNRENRSEGPAAMEPFFTTLLENYARTKGEVSPEEDTLSWVYVLDYLSGCLSADFFVPAPLLHLLATEGLLNQCDSDVQSRAHSLFLDIICLHPPLIGSPMCEAFRTGLFVRRRENKMDPMENRFFLNELIESCFLKENAHDSRQAGEKLLFQLTVLVLQHNFDDWAKKSHSVCVPIIVKLIWPEQDVSVNSSVRLLAVALAHSWKNGSDMRLRSSLMTLIAMVAQMIAASDTHNYRNLKKQEFAVLIIRQFQEEKDFHVNPSTTFARMLRYLKPSWLSVMISSIFLARNNEVQQAPTLSRLLKVVTSTNQTHDWPIVVEGTESKYSRKRNKYGETEMHRACKLGKLDRLRQLLSAPGAEIEINARDNNGWTPFHEACFYGRTDCVRLLLQTNRVNVLATGGEDGHTPLHEAVLEGRSTALQAVLDHVSESIGHGKHFSVSEIVQFPSRNGETVMELSDPESRMAIENALVAEQKLTRANGIGKKNIQLIAANCLGKYCSDSSLHVIMELIKPGGSPQCTFAVDAPESRRRAFGLVQTEETMAKDIRMYSTLLSRLDAEKSRIGTLVVLFGN